MDAPLSKRAYKMFTDDKFMEVSKKNTYMKYIKFAQNMTILLFLYFVIYNTIFGWNKLPINEAEETCDYIFKSGIFIALAIYFAPLFGVYQDFIKNREL